VFTFDKDMANADVDSRDVSRLNFLSLGFGLGLEQLSLNYITE